MSTKKSKTIEYNSKVKPLATKDMNATMNTCRRALLVSTCSANHCLPNQAVFRSFGKALSVPFSSAAVATPAQPADGSDPLDLLRSECQKRNLCDDEGYRLPNVHWTFAVAFSSSVSGDPPNLRTIGIQRVSENGIDFVVKRGSQSSKNFKMGMPVSILHLHGKYVAGQKAEQWRGEGHCELLHLSDVIKVVPDYTISAMVASKRIENESQWEKVDDDDENRIVASRSHATEVVQQTTSELQAGQLSIEELQDCIRAFRFHPDRIERMVGGPDQVFFDRWEWRRDSDKSGDCPEGTIPWADPVHLMPH